jgi:aminoglycoside phosphotransferase (APT) family kinase protein
VLYSLIERTASTKRTLIHGDVSPKNILEGEDRIIMLDAETATYGDPAFDLAFCLNHLLLKCVWRKVSREAFLSCFDALYQDYLHGVTYEPADAVEARTCGLLAAMLLARVDGKSPVEYITDEGERGRIREFAKGWLRALPIRLELIRSAWSDCWAERN